MIRIPLPPRARSGTAAIEFAVGSLAFLAFVFAVINIGSFALYTYALNRAAGVAARYAAIQATNLISAQGPIGSSFTVNAADCPSDQSIRQSFTAAAAPPWSATTNPPSVTIAWWGTMAICSGGAAGHQPPGGGVTISAQGAWPVIAGELLGVTSVDMAASQSMPVILSPAS